MKVIYGVEDAYVGCIQKCYPTKERALLAAFEIDVEHFMKHLEKYPDTKIADWNLAEDFENLLKYNCIDDVVYIYEMELKD